MMPVPPSNSLTDTIGKAAPSKSAKTDMQAQVGWAMAVVAVDMAAEVVSVVVSAVAEEALVEVGEDSAAVMAGEGAIPAADMMEMPALQLLPTPLPTLPPQAATAARSSMFETYVPDTLPVR
jgi:hypothetical protein